MSGTYAVEVRDDRAGWLKFLKAPVQSTWITIRHFHGLKGMLEDFRVLPQDLASALHKDKRSRESQKDHHGSKVISAAKNPPIRSTAEKVDDK